MCLIPMCQVKLFAPCSPISSWPCAWHVCQGAQRECGDSLQQVMVHWTGCTYGSKFIVYKWYTTHSVQMVKSSLFTIQSLLMVHSSFCTCGTLYSMYRWFKVHCVHTVKIVQSVQIIVPYVHVVHCTVCQIVHSLLCTYGMLYSHYIWFTVHCVNVVNWTVSTDGSHFMVNNWTCGTV